MWGEKSGERVGREAGIRFEGGENKNEGKKKESKNRKLSKIELFDLEKYFQLPRIAQASAGGREKVPLDFFSRYTKFAPRKVVAGEGGKRR